MNIVASSNTFTTVWNLDVQYLSWDDQSGKNEIIARIAYGKFRRKKIVYSAQEKKTTNLKVSVG